MTTSREERRQARKARNAERKEKIKKVAGKIKAKLKDPATRAKIKNAAKKVLHVASGGRIKL